MNITEKEAPRSLAEKVKSFRNGNRVMVQDDMNVKMTFFRRDTPEKKIGTLGVNGSCNLLIAATVVLSVLRAIRSVLRRF